MDLVIFRLFPSASVTIVVILSSRFIDFIDLVVCFFGFFLSFRFFDIVLVEKCLLYTFIIQKIQMEWCFLVDPPEVGRIVC